MALSDLLSAATDEARKLEAGEKPAPDEKPLFCYVITLKNMMMLHRFSESDAQTILKAWDAMRKNGAQLIWADGFGTLAGEIVDIALASPQEEQIILERYFGVAEDEDEKPQEVTRVERPVSEPAPAGVS